MSISEKTAYLKGLLEGLDIDRSKPEGKLLAAIVETLDEMAGDVKVLYSETDHINEYLDELDYDLGAVEEEVFCDPDDYDDGDDEWEDEDEDYEICPDPVCEECDKETCEGCDYADEE